MNENINNPLDSANQFDLKSNKKRIATHCVCCGSVKLRATPSILMPFVAERAFGWKPIEIDDSWGLHTIKKGNAYSICNTLHCVDCDLIFLDIRFDEQELKNIYNEYRGEQYVELREFYEPGYKKRNQDLINGFQYIEKIEYFLNPLLKLPVSMLDWGGNTGKNTPYKNNNKLFDIYDISKIDVIEGAHAIDKATAFRKKYDLIICSNVLEHVSYPGELLFDIKNCMKEDTILYIEVPFENIMQNNLASAYLNKKHWHEHINFYSELALVKLIESVGLKRVTFNKLTITAEGKPTCLLQIACQMAY
jgi:SAM-dependent methyltransferase